MNRNAHIIMKTFAIPQKKEEKEKMNMVEQLRRAQSFNAIDDDADNAAEKPSA